MVNITYVIQYLVNAASPALFRYYIRENLTLAATQFTKWASTYNGETELRQNTVQIQLNVKTIFRDTVARNTGQ